MEDEKLIIDKVKQLFRDARLTRRMRRLKKTPDGVDLAQTEITAPRLFANGGAGNMESKTAAASTEGQSSAGPRPPGITAAPGTVEEQLQLQRLRQQQKQEEQHPLEEQLKQKALEHQMKIQAQQQRKQAKQAKKAAKEREEAKAASAPAPSNVTTMPAHEAQPEPIQEFQDNPGMGMNMNTPATAVNANPGGMNLNPGTAMNLNPNPTANVNAGPGMNLNAMNFPGGMPSLGGGDNLMAQRQQQEFAALQQERERQELAELEMLRAQQDRQQNELRQQQELANLLQANQPQFAQQPMGMMPNDERAQLAFPGSFGAFPPDSINRVNNPAAMGRSGLVDLARLAELMQVTGQFPNQFNNQGGQPM